MSDLNQDGLKPGQDVDFETMMRINFERKNKKPAVIKKAKKSTAKVKENVTT